MLSIAELHPALHDLLHDTAEHLARDAGFCQRARKLTGPVFAQALVFTLLENPAATLDDFADTATDELDTPVTDGVIVALIPLALRGVPYRPSGATTVLRNNIYIDLSLHLVAGALASGRAFNDLGPLNLGDE